MEAFEMRQLVEERRKSGERYHEFVRAPTLSAGVFELSAGAVDTQTPHTEDEIYYVVSGRGVIRVGTEDRPVGPGAVVFVETGVEHRFHSIAEDLTVLVVFAPPRRSRALSS